MVDACAEATWRSSGSGRRSCVGCNPDNPASSTAPALSPTHARAPQTSLPTRKEKSTTSWSPHRPAASDGRAPAAVTPCLCASPLWPPDGAVSHSQSLLTRSPPANELNHEYVCCAQPGNARLPPGTGVPHSGSLITFSVTVAYILLSSSVQSQA